MITPSNWQLTHVDLVDATGTEVGFDNDPVGAIRADDIGVYVGLEELIVFYPMHRVLSIEFSNN